MSSRQVVDKIFVAIASYRDKELYGTIYSLLSKAKDLSRIYPVILSQDEDDKHPPIQHIMSFFGIKNYIYEKIYFKESSGVGFARTKTQKYLTTDYKYYLQVDSHTQFCQDWDEKVIEDYNKVTSFWGKNIMSSYPFGYEYDENGNIKFVDLGTPTALGVYFSKPEDALPYSPRYKNWEGTEFGDCTGYFCAGFAFGLTELFLQVPYDPKIYFQGEEHTMAMRFFAKGVKLIAPPRNYVYHSYDGSRRTRNWEDNPDWTMHDQRSNEHLKKFFSHEVDDIFNISDVYKVTEFYHCFVREDTTKENSP